MVKVPAALVNELESVLMGLLKRTGSESRRGVEMRTPNTVSLSQISPHSDFAISFTVFIPQNMCLRLVSLRKWNPACTSKDCRRWRLNGWSRGRQGGINLKKEFLRALVDKKKLSASATGDVSLGW